jgi:glycosyltransferase involved in cell wall biosynthesis
VVCHLIASNFLGGPEKQILEHAGRLAPHRWQAVLGTFREGRERVPMLDAARDRDLPVFTIDTRSPFSLRAVTQLRTRLREFGVDVLVTHGYKANVVGYLATRGSGVPQVPFVRGYTGETLRIRVYETLDRWVLRRFPRVLCVSRGTAGILARHGIAPERTVAVHNAVVLPSVPIAPRSLLREFDLPAGTRTLVAAGRLSTEKGHRFLIEALERLADRHPEAVVILFGEGREEPALRAQAVRAGLGDRIRFAGFRKGLVEYLAAADLVVNPSLTEGLPNVVLEAQSAGVPVVATEVGGVAEIITPRETGWLVPPGRSDLLAEAIEDALSHPERAAACGAAGRTRVASEFGFDVQARRLVEIYDALLTG